MQKTSSHWIAIDWGTSQLRVWVMDQQFQIRDQLNSSKGMGTLRPDEFEPTLIDLIAPYLSHNQQTIAIACGMVGAKQGWVEAAYQNLPCRPPSAIQAVKAPTGDERIKAYILPGLSQATPPDVMRGEETQIAGFLQAEPDFTGSICLPGTHSKWVQISNGKICHFTSFMTGELFDAISNNTVLRHSIDQNWDDDEFINNVTLAMDTPHLTSASLFSIRAQGLISKDDKTAMAARLSGLLTGLELAGARQYWQDCPVVLLGGNKHRLRYAKALAQLKVTARQISGEDTVLAGLVAAYKSLKEHECD